MGEAYLFLDRDACVRDINPAALRLARRPASEILGRHIGELAVMSNAERRELWARAITERTPLSSEMLYTWEDGRQAWLDVHAHPVEDGFAIFYRNVSEENRTRSELQQCRDELIHVSRVGSMGALAATLAHELAQPLSAAETTLATASKLLRPLASEVSDVRRALEQARGSVQRASQILARLRAFVVRRQVEAAPQDLHEIVADAGVLMLSYAQRGSVRIDFDLDPRGRHVLADPVQIQQVLVNLIKNAIEAMEALPEGVDRRLVVSTRQAGDHVAIEVSDCGPGLADMQARDLFEPFRTTKANGLGVGLSISRTIVEAHGGMIEAEPRDGGGTTFRFTLLRSAPPA